MPHILLRLYRTSAIADHIGALVQFHVGVYCPYYISVYLTSPLWSQHSLFVFTRVLRSNAAQEDIELSIRCPVTCCRTGKSLCYLMVTLKSKNNIITIINVHTMKNLLYYIYPSKSIQFVCTVPPCWECESADHALVHIQLPMGSSIA